MAACGVLLSPFLTSLDEMISWKLGALPPPEVTHFTLAPPKGSENEFRSAFNYRLSIWTPSTPKGATLAQFPRSLLYPYLPAVPTSARPSLNTYVVGGIELGGSRAPCAVEIPVPAGTPGVEGQAIVVREDPKAEEVIVRIRLMTTLGDTLTSQQLRIPAATATAERVQIAVPFPPNSTAEGGLRLVLEAMTSVSTNSALVLWGPLSWIR
jgi:hypothetical protein